MIAPLFRVPSRNSMLLDDTAQARAQRLRRAERDHRVGVALIGLAVVFALVMAWGLAVAWWAGRL